MAKEKRIEMCKMVARDIKTGFGNPRKITKAKREELKESILVHGDFGIFVIDEHDNIICGNQRLSVIMEIDETTVLDCKRLIGYSKSELKAINIRDNTHAGEWDMDMLAEWTADLSMDLGLDENEQDLDKQKIDDMEPIRFEKYNYVMIVCDNEIDYNELIRNLGLENRKVKIAKRKIAARAVWYQDMKAQIIPKEDAGKPRNRIAQPEDKKQDKKKAEGKEDEA